MDKGVWYALLTTIGIVAFAAIMAITIYFGSVRSQEISNQKMTTCVQEGGQWVQSNCVR